MAWEQLDMFPDWEGDSSGWIKEEHPNQFLRLYGDFMGGIASWFLHKSLPYATRYSNPAWDTEKEG